MTFTDAIASVFTNYATFSGRARRSEYWYFVLFNILASGTVMALCLALDFSVERVNAVYTIVMLLPSLALNWRRLHDIGKSGAWYLLNLIPVIGQIVLFIWSCQDSEKGVNKYGPNPKGIY